MRSKKFKKILKEIELIISLNKFSIKECGEIKSKLISIKKIVKNDVNKTKIRETEVKQNS